MPENELNQSEMSSESVSELASPEMPFLVDFFTSLNEASVEYCVLRNYETLPESLGGHDLDIYVYQDCLRKFCCILHNSVKRHNGYVIAVEGPPLLKICVSGDGHKWWGTRIDITHEGSEYFPVSMLSNCKMHANVSVSDDLSMYLGAVIKEVVNHGALQDHKTHYYNALMYIYSCDKAKVEALLNGMFGPKLANRWINALETGISVPKARVLAKMIKRHAYFSFMRSPMSFIKHIGQKLLRYCSKIWGVGISVAVLGTDGSGKSTVIAGIVDNLKTSVHNSIHYEHMRPNLLPNIGVLFGKKQQEGPCTNPHGSKPSGMLGSILRLAYYSVDYTVGYFARIYPRLAKNPCLVIFDRYYYDYLIDPARARINLPKWLIRMVGLCIPRPKVILCLGGDPEAIYARKPETSLEEVKRQTRQLRAFCEKTPGAFWIDTTQPIENSVHEAVQHIVKTMAARVKQELI